MLKNVLYHQNSASEKVPLYCTMLTIQDHVVYTCVCYKYSRNLLSLNVCVA